MKEQRPMAAHVTNIYYVWMGSDAKTQSTKKTLLKVSERKETCGRYNH